MTERAVLPTLALTLQKLSALRAADHIEVVLKNPSKSTVTCYSIVDKTLPVENKNLKKSTFVVPSMVRLVKHGEFFPQRSMDETIQASVLLEWSRYNWEIQTAFGLLQEGDEVDFIWLMDDGANTSFSNIFTDALNLVLYRAETRLHFRLTTVVARKRNRMISYAKKTRSDF